jgi:hypothetical protein
MHDAAQAHSMRSGAEGSVPSVAAACSSLLSGSSPPTPHRSAWARCACRCTCCCRSFWGSPISTGGSLSSSGVSWPQRRHRRPRLRTCCECGHAPPTPPPSPTRQPPEWLTFAWWRALLRRWLGYPDPAPPQPGGAARPAGAAAPAAEDGKRLVCDGVSSCGEYGHQDRQRPQPSASCMTTKKGSSWLLAAPTACSKGLGRVVARGGDGICEEASRQMGGRPAWISVDVPAHLSCCGPAGLVPMGALRGWQGWRKCSRRCGGAGDGVGRGCGAPGGGGGLGAAAEKSGGAAGG